ncbi:MAG TPA: hypothetical protein VH331_11745 [Allosphingosinicella sp.]|jgi:hypothetical protein|nr:hypothetical protein [Allosphingosinicella sp.]
MTDQPNATELPTQTGPKSSTIPYPKAKKRNPASDIRVGQKTRLACIVALFLSIFSALTTLWLIWAIRTNADALRQAHLIPQLDARFDSVAAAEAVGRLDVLSVVLTFIGIIAAIAIIYGWTAFKSAAVAAAVEEVERRLPDDLRLYMSNEGPVVLGRALEHAELVARLQERFTLVLIDDTETAVAVDTDAEWVETDDTEGKEG